MASTTALTASIFAFPPLAIPAAGLSIYTSQKFLNNTLYKSYKDLAFIARRKGDRMKIYQDVTRPDIFSKIRGLDVREKVGFLQLQAIVRNVKVWKRRRKRKTIIT